MTRLRDARAVSVPERAMVLSAGRGKRMRPITDERPKTLVEVAGRTLLDRALDRLAEAGVARVVVNTHYLAERVEAHLGTRNDLDIEITREDELMDTGGGVARVLDRLGEGPFFVVNGDVLWLDGPLAALMRLAREWDNASMDALLLVHCAVTARGYHGPGDFFVDQMGRLRRRREREVAPFVFTGVQLLHPRLFQGAPGGPFSLNRLYDRAEQAGRLFGVIHGGEWFHVGTPRALEEAERELAHFAPAAAAT